MADACCVACGAGMTGDEAALNYKYVNRQCRDFLCPVCLGRKLGLSSDELHRMIQVFRAQGCRLFSPLAPGEILPDPTAGQGSKA